MDSAILQESYSRGLLETVVPSTCYVSGSHGKYDVNVNNMLSIKAPSKFVSNVTK